MKKYAERVPTGMAAAERRILARLEQAIRTSDPDLASLLNDFDRFYRGARMPQTEKMPSCRRLNLSPLSPVLAVRSEPHVKRFIRYAPALFWLAVVIVLSIWLACHGPAQLASIDVACGHFILMYGCLP